MISSIFFPVLRCVFRTLLRSYPMKTSYTPLARYYSNRRTHSDIRSSDFTSDQPPNLFITFSTIHRFTEWNSLMRPWSLWMWILCALTFSTLFNGWHGMAIFFLNFHSNVLHKLLLLLKKNIARVGVIISDENQQQKSRFFFLCCVAHAWLMCVRKL